MTPILEQIKILLNDLTNAIIDGLILITDKL